MNPITALIRTYFVGRSRWVTDQLNCHWISGHQKRNSDCHNEIPPLQRPRSRLSPACLCSDVFGIVAAQFVGNFVNR